jgi:hypothetical protein
MFGLVAFMLAANIALSSALTRLLL